jgi:hypothetical protein
MRLSNKEKINKFCEDLNEKIGGVYTFHWDASENCMKDIENSLINVQLHVKSNVILENKEIETIRKPLFKGSIPMITDLLFPLNYCLVDPKKRHIVEEYPIKKLDDVENNVSKINDFLKNFIFGDK